MNKSPLNWIKTTALCGLIALPLACGQQVTPPANDVAVASSNNSRPLALVEADAAEVLQLAADVAIQAELLRVQFSEQLEVDLEAASTAITVSADEVRVSVDELSVEVSALAASGACDCGEAVEVNGPAGTALVDGCSVTATSDGSEVTVSSCGALVVALDAASDFANFSIDLTDALQIATEACDNAAADLDEAGLGADCDFIDIDPNLPAEVIADLEEAQAASCEAAAEAIAACADATAAIEDAAADIEAAADEVEEELAGFEEELEAELAALEAELAAQQAELEAELEALEAELAAAEEEARAEIEAALEEVEEALADAEEDLAAAQEEIDEAQDEVDGWLDGCVFTPEGCDAEDLEELCVLDDSCEDETEEGA